MSAAVTKSDGTEIGTVMVDDINQSGSSDPLALTNVNGTLFFRADDGDSGIELGVLHSPLTESLAALIDDLADLGLPVDIENDLLAKLSDALAILTDDNRENDGAAIGKLGAVIKKVEAQSGKQIDEGVADPLITAIQAVLDEIAGA